MCGILGLMTAKESKIASDLIKSSVSHLLKLSESRGKESSGVAIAGGNAINVYKRPVPASVLVHEQEYAELFAKIAGNGNGSHSNGHGLTEPVAIIGHARLVTNGAMEVNNNNQPVIKSRIVGVHNGIIVNDNTLWKQFPTLSRDYEVDTEVLLALIRMFLRDFPLNIAVRKAFELIRGSASIALLFEDLNYMVLATNTGSLYTLFGENNKVCIFASEAHILRSFAATDHLKDILGVYQISQVKPGTGLAININNLEPSVFPLIDVEEEHGADAIMTADFKIQDISPINDNGINLTSRVENALQTLPGSIKDNLVQTERVVDSLKRCTRCVLPETVPFIEFDENGVCNFCRNYKKIGQYGEEELEKYLAPFRSKSGEPDCILPFSGGRDSSYGLHYVKTILKMNPVAYTYDWGMVTDLARRNQARLCGKLGVEHIWVSADIKKKRENIRENILAWLKKPDLGMVPLFMAGDKQYFYFANRLRKQTGIKLVILCDNPYEKTDFKAGFCGIRPKFAEKSVYSQSLLNKAKLVGYYARQYILNPAYLNSSLKDTIGAFFSYYVIKHGYLSLYRYIQWDEPKIESALRSEYDWELATDTESTWRIGDGTAPFYNYIYYALAGFTENDTFRSNQIREGVLSREKALEVIKRDNRLRYESFKWYCDTVGINMEDVLVKINSSPRVYAKLIKERAHLQEK